MTIEFVEGDLFNHIGLDAIAHGVNCRGVMGAGVAAQIANKYSRMADTYKKICELSDFSPGDVFHWKATYVSPRHVFNLATQRYPGPDARLDAIHASVWRMLLIASTYEPRIKTFTIGIPQIGCGIGGLRWGEVRPILELLATSERVHNTVHLVVFEKYVPAKP